MATYLPGPGPVQAPQGGVFRGQGQYESSVDASTAASFSKDAAGNVSASCVTECHQRNIPEMNTSSPPDLREACGHTNYGAYYRWQKYQRNAHLLGLCSWRNRCSVSAFCGQFIGTLALTFGIAFVAATLSPYPGIDIIGTALAAGLILYGLNTTFSHQCGGGFNPLIAISNAVLGRTSLWVGLFFVIAQLLGGLLAGLFLRIVLIHVGGGIGVPMIGAGFTRWSVIFAETFGGAWLYWNVYYAEKHARDAALANAATLASIHFVLLRWSGASVNFARYLGPFVFQGAFRREIWVYFVADIFLAPLVAILGIWLWGFTGAYARPTIRGPAYE